MESSEGSGATISLDGRSSCCANAPGAVRIRKRTAAYLLIASESMLLRGAPGFPVVDRPNRILPRTGRPNEGPGGMEWQTPGDSGYTHCRRPEQHEEIPRRLPPRRTSLSCRK